MRLRACSFAGYLGSLYFYLVAEHRTICPVLVALHPIFIQDGFSSFDPLLVWTGRDSKSRNILELEQHAIHAVDDENSSRMV